MCTIGNIFFTDRGSGWNGVFKQCDLTDPTDFIDPVVCTAPQTGIRYLPFTRNKQNKSTLAWAGVNEHGVCFVAADSYLKEQDSSGAKGWNRRETVLEAGGTVFDMYLKLITHHATAEKAAESAAQWYESSLHSEHNDMSDILLVADGRSAYFIEAVVQDDCGRPVVKYGCLPASGGGAAPCPTVAGPEGMVIAYGLVYPGLKYGIIGCQS
jgi:hypothetical protein